MSTAVKKLITKKYNGEHELSKLIEIVDKLTETSDENRDDVAKVLAKYTKIQDGKLVINTQEKTNSDYNDLLKSVDELGKKQNTKTSKKKSSKDSKMQDTSNQNQYEEKEKTVKKDKPKEEIKSKDIPFRMEYIKNNNNDYSEESSKPIKKKTNTKTKAKVSNGKTYEYPCDNKYNRKKMTEYEYGPHAENWIHDEQYDDSENEDNAKHWKTVQGLMAVEYPAQRSEQWYKDRDTLTSASDGGCVVNENKYEQPFKFLLKKVFGSTFKGGSACYNGKKYEDVAIMIYENRLNVKVHEFGLVKHPKYKFLGASPDGIVGRYKRDGIHKSNLVGRMVEIKCPVSRVIEHNGEIKGDIVPDYYWVQIQLQLECCDLDECDFWQCALEEYDNRQEFIEDTDPDEPFRSKETGFEKGVVIQLMPLTKAQDVLDGNYEDTMYEVAEFLYPETVEMTPAECDRWVSEQVSSFNRDGYYVDAIKYWRLKNSGCKLVKRDKKWFEEHLPILENMWKRVEFLRANQDKANILKEWLASKKISVDMKFNPYKDKERAKKVNALVLDTVDKLMDIPPEDNKKKQAEYAKFVKSLIDETEKNTKTDSDSE